MVIDSDFEISYVVLTFALLGAILIGTVLDTLQLQKLHPRLVGATLGALVGFALIEAVPLFT
ncbi:hypothetical protein [Paraburkholderia tropica]|uniref:hypothetical protein n=1 Tax=Paraburkholderia tropica TaxID=92647 RepID=UPI002AB65F2C|nr:hypothetical protein [Paraburkholderia tropica]